MICENCRPKWTTARDVLQAELATHQRLADEARNDEARAIWRAALAEARIAIITERLAALDAPQDMQGIDNRWRGQHVTEDAC